MKKNKRNHPVEFKAKLAIEAIRERYHISEMADIFDVHASLIYAWKQLLRKNILAAFDADDGERGKEAAAELREVERHIEELRAEQEWMSRVAAEYIDLHARRDLVESENPGLSVLRKCSLLRLHRSGVYYRQDKEKQDNGGETDANSSATMDVDSPARPNE